MGGERSTAVLVSSTLIFGILMGCVETTPKSLYGLRDAELTHYKHVATQIDYSNACTPNREDLVASQTPRTLLDRRKDEIWDLPLPECLHLALKNNRIIRSNGTFLSPGISVSDRTSSVYDSAIQESAVLFSGRGVEAALADFDAQFTTSMVWGRNEMLVNSPFFGRFPGSTLSEDSGMFQSALRKKFGHGGELIVAHDWNYSGTNASGQLFPSLYTGNLRTEFRQPLWATSGTEFTRTAGAVNPNFGAITGVGQGVVIARINNDITLADFEAQVRNLLKDAEDLYWELYLRYRLYDTAIAARTSALSTWCDNKKIDDAGGLSGFDKATLLQSKDRYFETRAVAEAALSEIYSVEIRFRRLLGLSVNDGRIIRPADEPVDAQLIPDWHVNLSEALTRRVELRRQKWNIKSLELQLQAARSLTNPRLDFVSSYRVNAFGDHLFGQNDNDRFTAQGLSSAYETLTQGDQTGWTAGLELSMPLGFRSAHAQVRNYELRVAKAREVLAVLESDISHELATAFQHLAVHYANAQTNINRRQAAREYLKIFEIREDVGTSTVDLLLRAQASLADAEQAYFTSLVRYNQSIADLHFRKGTLLEHNDVQLAEDEWTPDAYHDALRAR